MPTGSALVELELVSGGSPCNYRIGAGFACGIAILIRQKNLWVSSGSGSLPSE
jgi:hypothetical protein